MLSPMCICKYNLCVRMYMYMNVYACFHLFLYIRMFICIQN
jgi:hypothetical protein